MEPRQEQIINDLFSVLCIGALPPIRLVRVLLALGYSTAEAITAIDLVYRLGFLRAARDNGSMPVGREKTEGAIEKYYLAYRDDWFAAQKDIIDTTWIRLERIGIVTIERTNEGMLAAFTGLRG
jgi:hypothetical protein